MESPRIRRALITVSDKLGLIDFGRALADADIELYSTGGTRRHLERHGVPVRDISMHTGFPEMMDGRLKTLHPKVFGGILCRHDRPDDFDAMADFDIVPFELVVVNLYPFEATVARPGVTEAEAIEQIDIGGPSLIRAAAKNHRWITIATSTEQYSSILEAIQDNGRTSLDLRRRLAREAFVRTAMYDRAIAAFFQNRASTSAFPDAHQIVLSKKMDLRYGENPHQAAALYAEPGHRGASLVNARQLNGKDLSYNNLLDLDAALGIVRMLADPACAVIKHSNPCGAAIAPSPADAASRALEGDPQSAFGSVLGFNRTVDTETAERLSRPGLFIEAIVAPDFEAAAIGILTTKPKWKDNVRLMRVGRLDNHQAPRHYRQIEGGLLVQDADVLPDIPSNWRTATARTTAPESRIDLAFAWTLVRHVKSNAIVVCREGTLWGAGAGQMSRVDSVDIALRKAGDRARGAVLASDAFFPFPDSIEIAARAGVAAIIQPGGSRRDDEVIAACDAHGIPMIFTGKRHFRH
ncbi:MAG: bifunctional phosphoribosylaminoimidazolecarboxamide formyltransferase/IMP cyclohydrolase [Planctomycetes bacterium]|nr:bifunctional phosphoribosylaminoimidazolecarboxamide formyltransferase/IMP cyclohydrolase [Planctomycetota bacterium]